MTIGTRLFLALSTLALALAGIAGLGWFQSREIDRRAALLSAEVRRIENVASIEGDLTRLQAIVSSATRGDSSFAAGHGPEFTAIQAEGDKLLRIYADSLVDDESGMRRFSAARDAFHRWTAMARHVIALGDSGRRELATGLARDSLDRLLPPLIGAMSQWDAYEGTQVAFARQHEADAVALAKQGGGYAVGAFALLCLACGVLLRQQISEPIRRLESAVMLISSGKFALRVPFTMRRDETGALARSIDALRLASFALENERWTKERVVLVVAALQPAQTLAAFGAALLSELIPMLGGGAGSLSVAHADDGSLRRAVAYGVAPDMPDPIERVTWPLESSDGRLLGVVDLATERLISERERALLVALMPQVAMLLELLQLGVSAFPPRRALPA